MASSKNSKTEKKTSKDGESTDVANKLSQARKEEDLEKKKKNQNNAKDKEKGKDQKKKKNKKENDNSKDKEQKNKKNKLSNGHVNEKKILIVPSSSTEEEEKTYEEDNTEVTNGRATETKPKKGKRKKGDDDKVAEDSETHRFPMHRIKTIIRAEDTDSRVSQEAVFVINKATEKFLEQLTQNAYACCVQDRKKSLSYKHLSSVVSKQKRYDFLTDFVPQKVKAEDALGMKNSGGTGALENY